VCSKGARRNAHLCVRSREGRVVILPDIRYSTWSQEVRGTAVSAISESTIEDMTAFVAWQNVLHGTKPTLMCIKDGSVVATDDPSLQDSDPFAVVVEETDRMTLQVVDVRVGKHSFPFLLRNDKDKNLREQILDQCDWRVHTLLSKLPELPPIVDGVMKVEKGACFLLRCYEVSDCECRAVCLCDRRCARGARNSGARGCTSRLRSQRACALPALRTFVHRLTSVVPAG
jgi:hypothetical protein